MNFLLDFFYGYFTCFLQFKGDKLSTLNFILSFLAIILIYALLKIIYVCWQGHHKVR